MPAKPNSENVGVVMEACSQEVMAAAKRQAAGQLVSKQQRTERWLIQIPFLFNPEPTKKEIKPIKNHSVKNTKKLNNRGKI